MDITSFVNDLGSLNDSQVGILNRILVAESMTRENVKFREKLIADFAAGPKAAEINETEDGMPSGFAVGDLVKWQSVKYGRELRGEIIGSVNNKMRVQTQDGRIFRLTGDEAEITDSLDS